MSDNGLFDQQTWTVLIGGFLGLLLYIPATLLLPRLKFMRDRFKFLRIPVKIIYWVFIAIPVLGAILLLVWNFLLRGEGTSEATKKVVLCMGLICNIPFVVWFIYLATVVFRIISDVNDEEKRNIKKGKQRLHFGKKTKQKK